MELSKAEAKFAIEKRLTVVKDSLGALDKLTAKTGQLEEELSKLKSDEAAILKDESRDNDAKLPDFLSIRGSIELRQAEIATLRGEPSHGNNTLPVPGKINETEHAVAKAGEDASRFVEAYHAAVLVAFQTTVKSSTAAFINPEDIHDLMQIAGRHPAVRQLRAFSVPSFAKVFGRGYEDAINSARMLPVIWSQLIEAADTIPGKLSVSIPDPWL
jgi:hypothetical protein